MFKVVEFSPSSAATMCGEPTLRFFAALWKHGLKSAIPNLSARLGAVIGPKGAVPIVVSIDGGGLCYLASFTRMYMDGAADELGASGSTVLRLFAPGVAVGGHAARAFGMDEIVIVDNNLYPTSDIGDWSELEIGAMTKALIETYPRRAIWVRGLTDRLHGAEIDRLKENGFVVAPSRPVEILDPTPANWKAPTNIRKDLTRLNRVPNVKVHIGGPFNDADFAAMERLSHSATVERHSALMPHYGAAFFRASSEWSDCRFVVLRDERSGALRGFVSMITGPKRITCGTLGYDATDEEHGQRLYRALISFEIEQAMQARCPLNIGYGATALKRLRGTTPALEMNAFYISHLPVLRRRLWQTTLAAMSALAGPVINRL